jgi:death-on-curing protein
LGIRDISLLESALARPFQTFGGDDLYATPYEKAAALLESIIKNHPFIDGNKRTGFLASITSLKKFQIKLTASETYAYDFVISVASSQITFEQIVEWLQQNSIHLLQ